MDKKDQQLVSVIMNCYNGEKYLREAIDSVYAQTYENWEIIFWDNASTDESAKIVKSYDSKLRYFKGEKTIPLGSARQKALEQCNGEYVCILDVDDVWFPNKLAIQVSFMQSNGFVFAHSPCHIINSKGTKVGMIKGFYKSGYVFKQFLHQFGLIFPSVIIRKSTLDKYDITFHPDTRASEEFFLGLQLAYIGTLGMISEPLSGYRVHNDSLTNRSIKEIADDWELTIRYFKRKYPESLLTYKHDFSYTHARIKYYNARYLIEVKDNLIKGRMLLRSIKFLDYKYFLLYIASFLPKRVWFFIHADAFKRVILRH